MSSWSLEPIFDSYLAVIIVAGVLAMLLLVRPAYRALSAGQWGVLLALRGAAVLLLLVAMLGPTHVSTTREPQTAVAVVMLDQSRSMQLPDASGDRSRWEAQRETLSRAAPLVRELSEKIKVKVYAYDSALAAIAWEDDHLVFPDAPGGDQTDLGSTLHDAIQQELGQRVAAVIVLGDGAQTATAPQVEPYQAARELARLQYPLYTVPFGPAGAASQARDVAIENLQDQYSVFVKNELVIRGLARVRGYVNQQIPVELAIEGAGGKTVATRQATVQAAEDGAQVPFQFTFTPESAGQYKLTVRAAEQPGELVAKNNQLNAFLTVREGGLKVLVLRGTSLFEQRALRRSLDASPDIDVEDRWIETRRRDRWPIDLTDALGDAEYDVFMLADLDSAALYEEGSQEQNVQLLTDAVAAGKGLIMLGGMHSFGPGGYRHTPLANVLPIVMDRFERQDFGAPFRPDLHLAGPLALQPVRPHFITHLASAEKNRQAWAALPPLTGANKFVDIKGGSHVLLESDTGARVLVAGQYGRGRVLAFAGDSTYLWPMHGFEAEHKRFWRQMVLWAAGRDEAQKDDVWIKLARRRFGPGEQVAFTVGANTAAGDVVEDAEFEVVVIDPEGRRSEVSATRDNEESRGEFGPVQMSGEYTIEAIARRDGEQIGAAQSRCEVFDQDVELSNPAADHDLLRRLANLTEASGGRMLAREELPELLRQLKHLPEQIAVERETRWRLAGTASDAWLFFLALAGAFIGEWTLRKKWGLA
ncbi:MAG: glutamine amidotransferase [Planctomycetes bacterium]|nr:glutamine amidotransferase [Planctomycetota bacterium]